MPQARPNHTWLHDLGTSIAEADPQLRANALSASAMWAANAATVSPAPDNLDGRCHLTVANLMTMPHRSHEWHGSLAQLKMAFADPSFVLHGPIPAPFGDEGAANHMRLCAGHDASGIEVFVYGRAGGPFPARQHLEASKAVARRHGVRTPLFIAQSEAAIAAGAFHNDVVAVANEHVLFAHELAFDDQQYCYAQLRRYIPNIEIIEVPNAAISLADAIQSYLFNAQLVTLPEGGMALILPTEAQENVRVWRWLQALIARNGPIRRLVPVDVRQSMANGGGPACLRLRVVCDPAKVDPRFLVDAAKLDHFAEIVAQYWPEYIDPTQLSQPALWREIETAHAALLKAADLEELIPNLPQAQQDPI